jgi:hypothetical protein
VEELGEAVAADARAAAASIGRKAKDRQRVAASITNVKGAWRPARHDVAADPQTIAVLY